ncbi:MAG: sorbosone dehydrogenase family protein [Gammaproteobacteria bacterium]|nr:sorbosone dehydrogenase family protein [Gammaproteobacteria bacterium]
MGFAMQFFKYVGVCAIFVIMSNAPIEAAAAAPPELRVPDGFSIETFYDDVPGARALARGDDGTIYVSTREVGSVYALSDEDGDGTPDRRRVLAQGMTQPTGIAWHDGDLYVAEIDHIWRYPDIAKHLDSPQRESVRDDLPDATHHGWRYIAFGPDGKLYVAIGAPCNICEPDDFVRDDRSLQFGSITRMNPDGSEWEVYARGIRNSVGFTWDDEGELWFTDNGRDWLGDDLPPGELNHASGPGEHFGYPYCHGGTVPDPEFGKGKDCDEFVAPAQALGPHVAPLGVKFYTGSQFPAAMRGQVFIAEHGSWNRSERIGYRVTRVRLDDDGKGVEYVPFVTGWLDGERVRGRPVDLLVQPDGSMLVSDDAQGRIYRVRYTGE